MKAGGGGEEAQQWLGGKREKTGSRYDLTPENASQVKGTWDLFTRVRLTRWNCC